jgi:regulator of nucleoside diphosphate kinase
MHYFNTELPPISLVADDLARLEILASAATRQGTPVADFLAQEIARAQVLAGPEILPGLVRMGSHVEYRDDATGDVRGVTLVFPDKADISQGKVSVLTPLGAALIGLSVTQSIEFETPSGGRRSITVLNVRDAVEA